MSNKIKTQAELLAETLARAEAAEAVAKKLYDALHGLDRTNIPDAEQEREVNDALEAYRVPIFKLDGEIVSREEFNRRLAPTEQEPSERGTPKPLYPSEIKTPSTSIGIEEGRGGGSDKLFQRPEGC